jgi:hypothetical protein
MIRYRLRCRDGHEFEGWFANSAAYDRQARRGLISCPECATSKVSKAPMAPNLATRSGANRSEAARPLALSRQSAVRRELLELMRRIRREVEARSEYVGPRFAEEARKIHYEEVAPRDIHGEATPKEVRELTEEGIEFFPLPILPEDRN